MELNPEATFDCLFVAHHRRTEAPTLAVAELHLFSYLACLLWLYRERVVADWGYTFVGTELGAPFSQEIDSSVREMLARGYFVRAGDRVRMTDEADRSLDDFLGLSLNRERAECLHAACSSTAAFSVGMVCTAIAQEPDLRRSQALRASRRLLEDAARVQLFEQFDALRSALTQSSDLRLPAVVWLAALYRAGEGVQAQ